MCASSCICRLVCLCVIFLCWIYVHQSLILCVDGFLFSEWSVSLSNAEIVAISTHQFIWSCFAVLFNPLWCLLKLGCFLNVFVLYFNNPDRLSYFVFYDIIVIFFWFVCSVYCSKLCCVFFIFMLLSTVPIILVVSIFICYVFYSVKFIVMYLYSLFY